MAVDRLAIGRPQLLSCPENLAAAVISGMLTSSTTKGVRMKCNSTAAVGL
jgi:hypothetical protein